MMSEMKNNNLRCLVVDDEAIATEGIVSYIKKIDFLQVAAVSSSAIEAGEVLREMEIDLMFLDINMPNLSGLDFLESLDRAPMTVFTTAYSEYALEGYKLNVVDYLLKPIGFQRFFQAVTKVREIFTSRLVLKDYAGGNSSGMYVRQGNAFRRIDCKDILFAEGMQNYIKLHFRNETLVIHQTMTSLEEMLPNNTFFRIHRSYLVNVQYIDSISGNRLFIAGQELPVSAPKMNELLHAVVYKNLISK